MTRFRLTSRGWVTVITAAACLGFGLWARYPGLVGLGAVLAVVLAAAAAGVLVPAPVRIRRTVRPARVARLQECHADISVTNSSTWLTLDAAGHDRVAGQEITFDLPRMAPGQVVRTEVPIPTERRGVVDFGPLTLHRSSLVDLIEVSQVHGSHTSVLVEPRIMDALGMPPGSRRGHVGADERIAHGGTDLVGLREYIPGDDLRRLHWATSARRGMLMVREDADPSAPHLTVLLDDRADSYRGEGFEEAVDVAASLLATAADAECPARVVSLSGDMDTDIPTVPLGIGPAGLDARVLGALARIQTTTGAVESHLFAGSPDVLALITGSAAQLPELLHTASGAPVGVVLIVDDEPEALISASEQVTLLRGPRAEELVHSWRQAVAQ